VAVRVIGSVPDDLAGVILRNVPGCDPGLRDPVMRLPGRRLSGPEQARYDLMDPVEAAKLPDEYDGGATAVPRTHS
jgi:hypothetical protein